MASQKMITLVIAIALTPLLAYSDQGNQIESGGTDCCTTMNPSVSVGTPIMEEIIVTAPRTTSGVIRIPIGSPTNDQLEITKSPNYPPNAQQEGQTRYNVGVCTRTLATSYPRTVSWGGVTLPVNSLAASQLEINYTRHQDVVVVEQKPASMPQHEAYGLFPQSYAYAVLAAMYPSGKPKIIATPQGPVEVLGQWDIPPTGGYVPGEIRSANPGPDSCNTNDVTERYYRSVVNRIGTAQAAPPTYNLFDYNCQHWAQEIVWRS